MACKTFHTALVAETRVRSVFRPHTRMCTQIIRLSSDTSRALERLLARTVLRRNKNSVWSVMKLCVLISLIVEHQIVVRSRRWFISWEIRDKEIKADWGKQCLAHIISPHVVQTLWSSASYPKVLTLNCEGRVEIWPGIQISCIPTVDLSQLAQTVQDQSWILTHCFSEASFLCGEQVWMVVFNITSYACKDF